MRRQARAPAGLLLLVALGAGSCSGDAGLTRLITPRTPGAGDWPAPSTASGALRMLQWSYDNRSLGKYGELITHDFVFYCSPLDSAGQDWVTRPFGRDDELISATHLFVGGGPEPPANEIQLTLDRNFLVAPDPDYAYYPPPDNNVPRDPLGRWHKRIRTSLTLRITIPDGSHVEIWGHATFYFVRGDSAIIPAALISKGHRPDSTRWWIRRWDDETADGVGPARASSWTRSHREPPVLESQPSKPYTWCALKTAYR